MIRTFLCSFLLAVCLSETISIARSFRHGHSFDKRSDSNLLATKKCPLVWHNVSSALAKQFHGSDGDCNDHARAAIRAAFHDAGTYSSKLAAAGRVGGGADGSLILAKEYNRTESRGLSDISSKLHALALRYNVGVADTIQFAAAHAIATCPGGPRVPTFVGRNDSSRPSPHGLLPGIDTADQHIALFKDKGFDEVDLAALVGVHTVSKQFFEDPSQAGAPQDDSVGLWDVDFYVEQFTPTPGAYRLKSMLDLSLDPVVGPQFREFIVDPREWNARFTDAMTRLSVLGVPGGTEHLIDCTDALPAGVV